MKKLFFLSFLTCISLAAQAQYLTPGTFDLDLKLKVISEVSLSQMAEMPCGTDLKTLDSRSYGLYWMGRIDLGKKDKGAEEGNEKGFNLSPGIGFTTSVYSFQDNMTLSKSIAPDGTSTLVFYELGIDDAKRSTLSLTYLDVPLELHYVAGGFRFAVGARAGVRLDAKTKVKYKDTDGDLYKVKAKNDFYTSLFRYGLTARLGFKTMSAFAYYGLNPVFETDKLDCDKDIRQLNIGLSFILGR